MQALILRHWPKLVALAAVLAVIGYVVWVHADRDRWRDLADKRLGELSQCQANVASLDGALKRQNKAVDDLKAEAKRREKQSAEALREARSTADGLRRKAQQVLQARPGADQCASADRLILESVQ